MKFWEAIKAMSEGRKVRVKTWEKDNYVHMGKDFFMDKRGTPWMECMFFGSLDCKKLEWEYWEDSFERERIFRENGKNDQSL